MLSNALWWLAHVGVVLDLRYPVLLPVGYAGLHGEPLDQEQPVIVEVSPVPGPVTSLSSVTVVFSEPVVGVDASDLRVNGIPASGVIGSGSTYTFTFPQPSFGLVQISWDMNCGITDLAVPANMFNPTGPTARWMYDLYDAGPLRVVAVNPPQNLKVRSLTQIEITFNKFVSGVDASDLLINGRPARKVSGAAAGPYVFEFDPRLS